MGEKKLEALLEMCPTLGHFTDKQVEAGASGVNTVLPKGCGKAITDPLGEMLLNWLGEWRNEQSGNTEAEMAGEHVPTHAETHSAPASGRSVPLFTEWELMNPDQPEGFINHRHHELRHARARR